MDRLKERVALITGAGRGIGRGIARRFAREGAKILVAEINAENGARTAKEVEELGSEALFIQTDVTVREQVDAAVQAAVDRWGRLDILVNNAWGGGTTTRLEWKTEENLRHGLEICVMAGYWSMQAAFPHMKAQGGGSIINFCSLNGVNAHMYTAEYNIGKEALRTLTRTAAREWAPHQIRCNVLCPAALTEAYEEFKKTSPDNFEQLEASVPLGRVGDPEHDVAGAALFLASEDSIYVTGNTIHVDGGCHINGSPWAPEAGEQPQ